MSVGGAIAPLAARVRNEAEADDGTGRGWKSVPNEPDDGAASSPDLIKIAQEELGLDGADALNAAVSLAERIRSRHLNRVADRILADCLASRDQRLDTVHVVTAAEFLAETEMPAVPLLGDLVACGHNVTVTAQYKAGKTELVLNAAAALVEGGKFLGRFDTTRPHRVCFLNFELTSDDFRARIRDMGLTAAALERLLVVNLRGVRLTLTTPAGRDWLIDRLAEHGAEVLVGDTYGAASSSCVESENDNAGARRFFATVDEIKAASGCASSIWTAHTGRKIHAEGAEHARGATVIDDWCDVRMVLSRDRESGVRFLSSEGRSRYSLPESALHYDQQSRALWLPEGSVGASRADRRQQAGARSVCDVVQAQPGITTSDLRDALAQTGIAGTTDKATAVTRARSMGLIHTHRVGHSVKHFLGADHPQGAPCGQ